MADPEAIGRYAEALALPLAGEDLAAVAVALDTWAATQPRLDAVERDAHAALAAFDPRWRRDER